MAASDLPQAVETLRRAAMQAIDRNDLNAARGFAEEIFRQAPEHPAAHAILAHIFEVGHDLDRARTHAAKAIEGDPANALARIALGQVCLREGKLEDVEAAVQPVTQSPPAFGNYSMMAWSLIGKARDRRGDTKGAFEAVTRSNRLLLEKYAAVREQFHPAHPSSVHAMKDFVSSLDISDWRAPPSSEMPVFLIGFPRSGTTLLDQILSSHSRVVCLEEKPFLWSAISQVMREGDVLERIVTFSDGDIEKIRADYWRRVGNAFDISAGQRLIDRQPLNVVLLPLIKRIWPDARFIFALRDPRDVVLSCYEQSFLVNVAMAQFWELERAADYYDAVMGLFVASRARLKLDILEVRYENVVAEPEAAARLLTSYLQVPFEQKMLDHRTIARARHITTASSRQVVEAIYLSSIGRWRRYSDELEPVLPVLNAWARRLGYEA